MQSVYSTGLADGATRQSFRETYPSAKMQSVYSIALPADWVTKGLERGLEEFEIGGKIETTQTTALLEYWEKS